MQGILIIASKAFKSLCIVVGTMSIIDFTWSRSRKHKTTDNKSD